MVRPRQGSDALPLHRLLPLSAICLACGHAAHIVYRTERTITTLSGQYRLHLAMRRCRYSACPRYHQPYRPEAEGAWALPHGEYGLDVIAFSRRSISWGRPPGLAAGIKGSRIAHSLS